MTTFVKDLDKLDAAAFVMAPEVSELCVSACLVGGIRAGPGAVIVDRRKEDSYAVGYQSCDHLDLPDSIREQMVDLVRQTIPRWPEFGMTTVVYERTRTRVLQVLPAWAVVNRARYRFEGEETAGASEYRKGGGTWE